MTPGIRTLCIEFTRRDLPGSLTVACIGPAFIHGPTDWSDAHVTVELAPDGDGFIVRDTAADVRITTARIEISTVNENARDV